PSVRAAAVYELGPEDGEALRALAREDADTRVRRAAVTRLDEADVLAVVARASTSAEVREAIVDLLEDQKALGSLSRHAADNSTRLRALARVTDAEELLNVALKAEHTDVAVAALERIEAAEPLAAIAQRARNKVAARRARTKLRMLEEPQQAPPADAVSMSAADQQRAKELLQRAEALVAIADPGEAASKLSQARLAWAEFQADVVVDAALAQQFESASDAAREAIAERQQELAAERERAEAVAREQADRVAICHEIEGLGGEPAMDRIAELKVRWDGLPPMPSEYAASLR